MRHSTLGLREYRVFKGLKTASTLRSLKCVKNIEKINVFLNYLLPKSLNLAKSLKSDSLRPSEKDDVIFVHLSLFQAPGCTEHYRGSTDSTPGKVSFQRTLLLRRKSASNVETCRRRICLGGSVVPVHQQALPRANQTGPHR